MTKSLKIWLNFIGRTFKKSKTKKKEVMHSFVVYMVLIEKKLLKTKLIFKCLIRFSQNRKNKKKTKGKHVNLSEAYW